ncbi:MAG: hypothetical protein M1834_007562 [Cirrosporium novae-zelandiae]|nr:MAG: hypothetical protein M1834_007562 [Cirrosporium novae-zelandiae]
MATVGKNRAIEEISLLKHHRSIVIPPDPSCEFLTDPLRVSYSLAGSLDSPRTLFIIPGMYGSRYLNTVYDRLAQEHKIRLLCLDRPGLGGSAAVPLAQRIPAWLEIVQRIFNYHGIRHVSILSHCAGTIYLLNFLIHLRHYLDPERPSVTLFSPWVHYDHSGVGFLRLAGMLPENFVGKFDSINRFVLRNINPALQFSAGPISASMTGARPALPSDEARAYTAADKEEREYKETLSALVMDNLFAESTLGANDEALLCLKAREGLWNAFEDEDDAILKIAKQEQKRQQEGHVELEVRVFFPEKDVLCSHKGQGWFDSCWREEEVRKYLDYRSEWVAGADHDSVVDLEKGVVQRVFKGVSGVS